MNIYFVVGASGSGKTSMLKDLQKMLGKSVIVYDFDDRGC
jgi:uridine kinase